MREVWPTYNPRLFVQRTSVVPIIYASEPSGASIQFSIPTTRYPQIHRSSVSRNVRSAHTVAARALLSVMCCKKKAMNVHHDTGVHTHAVVFNILIPLSALVLLPMKRRFFFAPDANDFKQRTVTNIITIRLCFFNFSLLFLLWKWTTRMWEIDTCLKWV